MAAQAAVSAIRKGCEMLKEGKAEIDKFKKDVEGGVASAKAIYKEVTGLWGWLKKLFGGSSGEPVAPKLTQNPQQPALEQEKTPAKRKAKQPEPELSYEEFQTKAVHEICEHLKVYFEAQRQLREHCRDLEEQAKTTDKVADAAIDRIEIEWQMRQLQIQVREAMIYGTPAELGLAAMYENFLKTYDEIVEEQEFARQLKAKKERDAKWQRDLLRNHRIDRAVTGAVVLLLVLWMWGFLLSLGWLVKTHAGSSLA
jgi:hypothetical protein